MSFLPESRLALLGDDDTFYLIDLEYNFRIILSFNLPNSGILDFATDVYGSTIAFLITNGQVALYDLRRLLSNEERTANKRLNMGVPEELVHATLKQENLDDLLCKPL
jgi:hypothetical protein